MLDDCKDIHSTVVAVQRQTLPWETISAEQFQEASREFCRIWGRPDDYVLKFKQLWDDTFGFGYFATRARLKQLSESSVCCLKGVEWVPFQDYKNIPEQSGLYVFLDDDDWLAPDIVDRLARYDLQDTDALLWRTISIGSPQQEYPVFVWGLNGRCMTNNYGFMGRWLTPFSRVREVVQHAGAIEQMQHLSKLREVDELLSATNKSPCSSVSLERGLAGVYESQKLVVLVKDYLDKMATRLPEHRHNADWLEPLIQQTVEVFAEVYASRYKY